MRCREVQGPFKARLGAGPRRRVLTRAPRCVLVRRFVGALLAYFSGGFLYNVLARRAAPGPRALPHAEALQVPPPPPPPRTKWTRRVPHPVLIGHTSSLTPY